MSSNAAALLESAMHGQAEMSKRNTQAVRVDVLWCEKQLGAKVLESGVEGGREPELAGASKVRRVHGAPFMKLP